MWAAKITQPFVGVMVCNFWSSFRLTSVVLFGSHINFSGGQHGYSGDFKYAEQTYKNELILYRVGQREIENGGEFVSYGLDVLLWLPLIFEYVYHSWCMVPELLLLAEVCFFGTVSCT